MLTGNGFSSFPLDVLLITDMDSNVSDVTKRPGEGGCRTKVFCVKSFYKNKYFSIEVLV